MLSFGLTSPRSRRLSTDCSNSPGKGDCPSTLPRSGRPTLTWPSPSFMLWPSESHTSDTCLGESGGQSKPVLFPVAINDLLVIAV